MNSGKQIRNVVILFSVPQNTGDEALLEAMKQGLKLFMPGIKFSLTVKSLHFLPAGVLDNKIVYDPDEAIFRDTNVSRSYWLQRIRKILSRLGILHLAVKYAWWATSWWKETMAEIDKADLIILSGGGYLNDTYDARPKLAAITRIAARTSTPIILMGQSVGPFWRNSSINLFGKALSQMSVISLRESISLQWIPDHLKQDVQILPDLAFFLYRESNVVLEKKNKANGIHIGVCFRSWGNDQKYIEDLGVIVVSRLMAHYGANITFISTCQGIPGYVDDQDMSTKITVRTGMTDTIKIDRIHHSPDSFLSACMSFDAVISMRLHGCILSMLSGTPAFCIGYEDKSEGIYEMLGFEKYHIHYKQKPDYILNAIDTFMDSIRVTTQELPVKMADMYEKSTMNFEQLKPFESHE